MFKLWMPDQMKHGTEGTEILVVNLAFQGRGATITKNILKWICWWYSNIKFILEVPQVVACIALKIKSLIDLPPIRVA